MSRKNGFQRFLFILAALLFFLSTQNVSHAQCWWHWWMGNCNEHDDSNNCPNLTEGGYIVGTECGHINSGIDYDIYQRDTITGDMGFVPWGEHAGPTINTACWTTITCTYDEPDIDTGMQMCLAGLNSQVTPHNATTDIPGLDCYTIFFGGGGGGGDDGGGGEDGGSGQ